MEKFDNPAILASLLVFVFLLVVFIKILAIIIIPLIVIVCLAFIYFNCPKSSKWIDWLKHSKEKNN